MAFCERQAVHGNARFKATERHGELDGDERVWAERSLVEETKERLYGVFEDMVNNKLPFPASPSLHSPVGVELDLDVA